MKNKLLIFLYHDLESDDFFNEKVNGAASDTVVNAVEFDKQMQFLAESSYSTISINEYLSLKDPSLARNKVLISFDDGHLSNYTLAFPILKKYGFTATFFIVGNRIDKKHHMTDEQIRELKEHGMEIGSHGFSHGFLPQMTSNEIKYELVESKRILSMLIGDSVDIFAFPGGHYNEEVLKLLPACGYKGACCCKQGLNSLNSNPLLLKRVEIRKRFSIQDFQNVFNPGYILFYQLVDTLKSFIRNFVGLDRYVKLRKRFYKFYLFKR